MQDYLGGIPARRIRLYPPPGFATLADVERIDANEDRLCEFEHGVLVEKTMGFYESEVALEIIFYLQLYLKKNPIGKLGGSDGGLVFKPGIMRMPDATFISFERVPEEGMKTPAYPAVVPDLVVEVLSEGNTKGEMDRKLNLYFESGVRLVWYVDPASRRAKQFSSVEQSTEIDETGVLLGGDVLPGLEIQLADVFVAADRQKEGI